MLQDVRTGKIKKQKEGECLLCNAKNPTKHSVFGMSFCDECWSVMSNENEMEKRIKWENNMDDDNPHIDLINRLKELSDGIKVTLVLVDIFGNPFDYPVTYTGPIEQHGYFSKGGGWGLYKIESLSDVECYRIKVRPYRKRGEVWLNIGSKVIDYKLGW